jgi:type III secretion system (T3SS) negative regulator GrlR
MQDGIYHVHFSTPKGSGEGLVVIKQASVNGGDIGYLYTGQLTDNGGALSGHLKVKRWKAGPVSLMDQLGNYELQLSGQAAADNSFTVSGGIPSQPSLKITIGGRFLSAAA